jgi:hypothetical protein
MTGDRGPDAPLPAAALRAGLALSGLGLSDLWMAYVGIGGSLTSAELEEALQGRRSLSDHEHDVVAQALNDHFTSIGQDHPVAYSHELAEHGATRPEP